MEKMEGVPQLIEEPKWETGKQSINDVSYLMNAQMPNWRKEAIQAQIDSRLKNIDRDIQIYRDQAEIDKLTSFRSMINQPPYSRPYMEADPETGKYVVGVETNVGSTLFLDKGHGLSFEEAKTAAEALSDYYMSLPEPDNTIPSYSNEKGWFIPEKE